MGEGERERREGRGERERRKGRGERERRKGRERGGNGWVDQRERRLCSWFFAVLVILRYRFHGISIGLGKKARCDSVEYLEYAPCIIL